MASFVTSSAEAVDIEQFLQVMADTFVEVKNAKVLYCSIYFVHLSCPGALLSLYCCANEYLMHIQIIMVDKDFAEIKAIRAVFGDAVEIRLCFFHTLQAVRRWIERKENHVDTYLHDRILHGFTCLKFQRGMLTIFIVSSSFIYAAGYSEYLYWITLLYIFFQCLQTSTASKN